MVYLTVTMKQGISLKQKLTIWLGYAGWHVSSWDPPVSMFTSVGITGMYSHINVLHMFWEFEFMSSCLYSKYSFTHSNFFSPFSGPLQHSSKIARLSSSFFTRKGK